MTDIFGPASALNAVTVRPAETRTFGLLDTWFQPCSAPGRQDGTQLQAVWANGITATLRQAVDGMAITRVAGDDTLLLKAIQAASVRYAVDTSTVANTIVIAPSPPVTALTAGLSLRVKAANTITGASTIAVSGLAAVAFERSDGTATQNGDIVAGQIFEIAYDGAAFRLQSPKEASTLVTDSSLTGSGTTASPLAVVTSGTLATPGYTKLPNGLILQWARGAALTNTGSQTQTVTFPIAFPHGVFGVQVTTESVGGLDLSTDCIYEVVYSTLSTSSVQVAINYFNASANNYAYTPFIFALGY